MVFEQRGSMAILSAEVGEGRQGADEMVIRVIPIDLACSYIKPSTSLDTAEVHSSRIA